MVKVRDSYPINAVGDVEISLWADNIVDIAKLDAAAKPLLVNAATAAQKAEEQAIQNDHIWSERSSSFLTGLEMAHILAELQLDQEALIAAVVYRSVREGKISVEQAESEYGDEVSKLIDGVLRMAAIRSIRNDSDDHVFGLDATDQVENVRKMLVAMVDDVRVALLKLAERTCAIRAVKDASIQTRIKVSREIADIYAPLAHRLGIGHIKWELEDLAFRYLKPDDYKSIAKLLDEKRTDRQLYIDKVIDSLKIQVKQHGINALIYGRAKHIYSIWRKMQRKNISFSEVYDIRAVRILVSNANECFEVLGIVHAMWRPVPNEFDDYVSAPKENGYRSLHTAVIGPDNKVIEVQIRSHAMHEEAEFGVCSHWRYKGTDSSSDDASSKSYDQKIEWLRQVLEWHDELGVNPLEDEGKQALEEDRIYLFTPEGHIVDLPQGATPLDFAYRIHTAIGHRCRGAKVNGRVVQLNTLLNTADQVEIITGKQEVPIRDWLNDSLGYLNTSRARARVRQWFGMQARDRNIADGRALLDREFIRLGFKDINLEVLVSTLSLNDLDSLYASIGSGDISINKVVRVAHQLIYPDDVLNVQPIEQSSSEGEGSHIWGVGNLPTIMAECCHPVPGDDIAAYVENDTAVVHRMDCQSALQVMAENPEHIIKVSWGRVTHENYEVRIIVKAYDRHGLLRDIANLLDAAGINVTAIQTLSNKVQHRVDMEITVEIKDFAALSRIMAQITQLPNIASVERKV